MIDLKTNYMGLTLKNPVVVSSSKLTSTIGNIQKCEASGAAAVVLKSLFEEQILEKTNVSLNKESMYFWYAEAADAIKNVAKESDLDEYLELLREAKQKVSIPIIASVNCVSAEEWPVFAKKMMEAGADGLELNIAIFPPNEDISGEAVEKTYVDIVKKVKANLSIPLAVKIGYHFSNIRRMVSVLKDAGADAVVLFNRFYQTDIDIHTNSFKNPDFISSREEMGTTLRWVGLLSSNAGLDISASTGIHEGEDVIKQLLVGAQTVQLCSALYKKGIQHIETILKDIEEYMNKNKLQSIEKFRGNLSGLKENSEAFERIQYMKRNFDSL